MKLSIAFYSFWTFVVLAIFQVMEVTSWSWGYVLLPAAVFLGALVREMEIDIAVDKYLRIVVLVGASALMPANDSRGHFLVGSLMSGS